MTAPIQEPNLYRHASGLQWGQNQLFRRPSPVTGANSWPWIVLYNQGQTLPGDGNFYESLFTEAYWDPVITLTPLSGLSGSPFFLRAVQDSSGDWYWQLEFSIEGWYLIDMVHSVDDPSDGAAGCFFQQRVSQSNGVPFLTDAQLGATGAWDGTGGSHMDVQPWLETHRIIWAANNDTNRLYEPFVRQNTGVDKGVFGTFKVFYLGGLGGSTDNADWDFEMVAT